MLVKRALLIGFLYGVFFSASGQKNVDIGLFAGTSYYLGDLNNARQFYNPNFAYGGLARFNYNSRWSFRISLFGGGLSGDDMDFIYNYQRIRKRTFFTPIVELTCQAELNFMPYKIGDKRNKFSPYVHAGGTFLIASYALQPYQPAIPFGVGIKFNVLPRIGMGLEWTFRKTFTDGIDKVTWHKEFPAVTGKNGNYLFKQTGYFHQRDWYSFAGLFITYKINISDSNCNAYN